MKYWRMYNVLLKWITLAYFEVSVVSLQQNYLHARILTGRAVQLDCVELSLRQTAEPSSFLTVVTEANARYMAIALICFCCFKQLSIKA
jgi:hypothetical protein